MLLFGHKYLKDYVRIVWEKHASLLVRSFVEQEIDLGFSNVTGLEKVRLHPPGYGNDPIAIFMRPDKIQAIWDHERALRERYPRLATNNISELPNELQFRHAVPAVVRRILSEMEKGIPLEKMEQCKWLDMSAWKFEI
jgi:hypothetical protein